MGVHIEPLPLCSDDLSVHFPPFSNMSAKDYVGRTVIHIDHEVSPALFRPIAEGPKGSVMVRNVPDIDFDTACEALSLESHAHVETGFYWYHYQGPPGLLNGRADSSWSVGGQRYEQWPNTSRLTPQHFEGVETLIPFDRSGPKLSEEHLGDTLKAIKALGSEDRTRTAIARWVKSRAGRQSLVDQFIDLRIALEALYLQDVQDERTSQEMRFRLALFGAWHLGANFSDRQSIRKKLRNSYDRASGAVHRGSISHDSDNVDLLSDGQELCRRGIQKLLREGPSKNWGDLILGAEYDAGPDLGE